MSSYGDFAKYLKQQADTPQGIVECQKNRPADICLFNRNLHCPESFSMLRQLSSLQPGLPFIIICGNGRGPMQSSAAPAGPATSSTKRLRDQKLLQLAVQRTADRYELPDSKSALDNQMDSAVLISLLEEERKRLARELHDSVGSELAAIKVGLEARKTFEEEGKPVPEAFSLENLISQVQTTIRELRRIGINLKPRMLEELGLLATIRWVCRNFQENHESIEISTKVDINENEVPDGLKTSIFRIVQEALNNAAKHSGASTIDLHVKKHENKLMMTIKDNGRGFDPAQALTFKKAGCGRGLIGIRERAELHGGSLDISSQKKQGCCIRVVWPVPSSPT